jgi:hypothetical protein
MLLCTWRWLPTCLPLHRPPRPQGKDQACISAAQEALLKICPGAASAAGHGGHPDDDDDGAM